MWSETPSNRNQLSTRRSPLSQGARYETVFGDVSKIIDAARESAARSVNAAMTAAYWLIGRRIVEFEQAGEERAEYGAALIERLAEDLTRRFGRGFSLQNIYRMRLFYLAFPPDRILSTPSGNRLHPIKGGSSRRRRENSRPPHTAWDSTTFWLPSRCHGRPTCGCCRSATTAPASSTRPRRCEGMVRPTARPADRLPVLRAHRPVQEQGRHTDEWPDTPLQRPRAARGASQGPLRLEFLDLKDEYSESDLEDALIRHLETFLMEMGDDFCFIGRQKRLRVGGQWYRVDLLFYHRGCDVSWSST